MPSRPLTLKAKRMPGRRPAANRQRTREWHTGSKVWLAIRAEVLARDRYQCAACGKYGNQVDHIDGNSRHNPADGSNWQTLCHSCHSAKTLREVTGGQHRSPP